MTSEKRGRPRRSSTRALEEAAAELFLEQGYPHTTVDDIASRAGVSRATFFNYFHNKSDVLWVDVDRALVLPLAVGYGGIAPWAGHWNFLLTMPRPRRCL